MALPCELACTGRRVPVSEVMWKPRCGGFAGDEDELVTGQAGQMDRLAEARGHGAQMGAGRAPERSSPAGRRSSSKR